MSEMTDKEELLAAHRKEKKDLIAKTQKMKHGVPKGDKKKKKEVSNEIEKMLAELDLKHENEIKEFDKKGHINFETLENSSEKEEDSQDVQTLPQSKDEDPIDDNLENHADKAECDKTPRISKAQKRKNKKAKLEKERLNAIAAQEMENLSGVRHSESEQIMKKLSERNLTVYEVPSDGDCLYKAVEHQLSSQNLKETTVQLLREETAQYLLIHMDDYIPFLTSPETDVFTEDQFVKYCEDIVNTPTWGGHIEVQVLSHVCGYPIEIIQAQGPSIFAGDESTNPKLILSYHRHAFGLGEHYNSVVPITEE